MKSFSLPIAYDRPVGGTRTSLAPTLAVGYGIVIACIALLRGPFSPLDEGAHFLFMDHIARTGTLPLVSDAMQVERLMQITQDLGHAPSGIPPADLLFYQAFQVPLYYLFGAGIIKLLSVANPGLGTVFLALRLVSAVTVALGMLMLFRACDRLGKRAGGDSRQLFYAATLIWAMSPLFLFVMTTVSNDVPLFFLGSWLFLKILECLDGERPLSFLAGGALCATTVLTKMSGIYICLLYIATLALFRHWRSLCGAVIMPVLCLTPWLVFNREHYGELTAWQPHLAIVLPIINPGGTHLRLIQTLLNGSHVFLVDFFSFRQTGWRHLPTMLASLFLGFGCAITFAGLCRQVWSRRRELVGLLRDSKFILAVVMLAGGLAPLLSGVVTTWRVQGWYVNPRYAFASALCYIFFIERAWSWLLAPEVRSRVAWCLAFGFAVAVLASARTLLA